MRTSLLARTPQEMLDYVVALGEQALTPRVIRYQTRQTATKAALELRALLSACYDCDESRLRAAARRVLRDYAIEARNCTVVIRPRVQRATLKAFTADLRRLTAGATK